MGTQRFFVILALLLTGRLTVSGQTADPGPSDYGASHRLPTSLPPQIWAWGPGRTVTDGFQKSLDDISNYTDFGLLSTAMRNPAYEITNAETHDYLKRVVEYAHSRGLRVALDLDIRNAKAAFQKKHPDQMQWMLRVRSFPFPAGKPARVEIEGTSLRDHMGAHDVISGKLVRVFQAAGSARQTPGALQELKDGVNVLEQSKARVRIEVPGGARADGAELIVVVAFEYRDADLFSPLLMPFERGIMQQYRDVRLDGCMKDEWGFPPVYNLGPRDGDFWYSEALAAEYAKAGGGDFVRDCLLMRFGFGGTYGQRVAAVNRHMRLILNRNALLEGTFYKNVKEFFGAQAVPVVHATWGFMPSGDAFKNGYVWWQAKRDFGQTDEHWPLPVRTALAKKMGGPVWYNQFYHNDVANYWTEVWRNAAAGGRVNYLPYPPELWRDQTLMRAESRIRLLNYISHAPADSPVAVVFGHAAALNWVGQHFGDLGVDFANDMGQLGFRADVIPSTEIDSGALKLDGDGYVAYGAQKYRAVVFINPEYEPDSTFDFLRGAALSKTMIFMRGGSHLTFDGKPRAEQDSLIPGVMMDPSPGRVAQDLTNWHSPHDWPADLLRLTDGTCILARGTKDPAGDVIEETFYCGSVKVKVRATGVFGIKFSGTGEVESLAVSDLKLLETNKLRLDLSEPADFVLMRGQDGGFEGVFQGDQILPQALAQLTRRWTRLGHARPPAK
jgi:hypothetical protein